MKAFLNDKSTLSCECRCSKFANKDHNCIKTDNLKIITNNEMWKLFFKDPKCHENRTADYQTEESIITGIKSCIQSKCNKLGVITLSFSERTQTVISKIDEKVSHLSIKLTAENNKNTLKLITEELKMLHNKFVVVPIKNTSGNVAFVCKRDYLKFYH